MPNKVRQIKVWNNYDPTLFLNSIEESLFSWNFIKNCDVNVKKNWILNILSTAANQFSSIKTIKTKSDFFDNELETMRIEKNRLYKLAQYSNESEDTASKWHEYRLFKNEYKNTIQIKKYESNQRKLNRVEGDMKGTWLALNSILQKENSEKNTIKVGEIEIEDDLQIANEFNKYFITSIIELNESIPHHQYEEEIAADCNISFEFRCVTISEIKTCLKELNNNTDDFFLNPKVLLDSMEYLGQQIANIINESFTSGVFPEALKTSTIVPIQKKVGS